MGNSNCSNCSNGPWSGEKDNLKIEFWMKKWNFTITNCPNEKEQIQRDADFRCVEKTGIRHESVGYM